MPWSKIEVLLFIKTIAVIFLIGITTWVCPSIAEAEVALVSPVTLRISGEIDAQTAKEFADLVSNHPDVRTVELDSPGGLVYDALEIANHIAASNINTWVRSSSRCASACSIIFLAGQLRVADGKLGVHQVSGVYDPSATQSVIADIYSSLTKFRTPEKLIYIMLRTPPDDMYFFAPRELDEYGINIRVGDAAAYEPPHLQVLTSQLYKDWLVGTFLNTHTQQPFFAMESRAMNPVFRLVHYPNRNVTFFEVIWDKPFQNQAQTQLRFRFHRGDEQPYDAWVRVSQDNNGFYADIPSRRNAGEAVDLFLAAFLYGTSLSVSDFSGAPLAAFSLMGTKRLSNVFTDLIDQAHRN
ncbi:hypothetical protein [Sulfitobacter noctilucicola]|uniref:ATP-dependent protease ClpP protease subunit n=1 Tax=Sulfitobacter noctilucicola TaxID=1342301 RepID=A0A7W6M7X8_9RHOB|nr:hypothetical protein [Sulfitobacter noctilucicola]MBB4173772.1 ATP-dependent protease ClpP protease subunit [Sulfitobacter noctilucicola]